MYCSWLREYYVTSDCIHVHITRYGIRPRLLKTFRTNLTAPAAIVTRQIRVLLITPPWCRETHTVLVNNYNGKLLNGPNDVWINPTNGGMYITDPIFPRSYWDVGDPRQQAWPPTHSEQAATGKGGYVYYLAPGRHTLLRVTTE